MFNLNGFYTTMVLLFAVSPEPVWSQELPNIIYILVDDLGYGDINLNQPSWDRFNNPNVKTPHLERLAKQGMVLTHHYSSSPVCSPSRAGLMTGRTPTRLNIGLFIRDTKDDDVYFMRGQEWTIAEVVKQKNYHTSVFGKWHLNGADWENKENWNGWTGSFPNQQGFDEGLVSKENPHFTRKLKVNTQKNPGDFFTLDGEPAGPIKGYSSDIITKYAINWIQKVRQSDRPFFTFLSYDAVHIRVDAADKYLDLYDTGNARKDAYYANITHLDAAIGELLDSLERFGLIENTLLFFSSDNGPDVLYNWDATYFCYGTSYPLFGQKYQLEEGGIRVPGIISWPARIKPGTSDVPNSTLDVLPTLADVVGVPLPEEIQLDGQSLLPVLLGSESLARKEPIYWQFDLPRLYGPPVGEGYQRRLEAPWHAPEGYFLRAKIRDDDYIMEGYSADLTQIPDQFKLYNIVMDPNQQKDLCGTEAKQCIQMQNQLISKFEAVQQDQQRTIQWIKSHSPQKR